MSEANANGDILPSTHLTIVLVDDEGEPVADLDPMTVTLTDWDISMHRDVSLEEGELVSGEATLTLKGVELTYD